MYTNKLNKNAPRPVDLLEGSYIIILIYVYSKKMLTKQRFCDKTT
jgi:hypothetical protein